MDTQADIPPAVSESFKPTRKAPRTEDVIAFVDERWGELCVRCSIDLLGHDAVLSMFLGFREAPRCARCLAEAHGTDLSGFLERAVANISRLACYRAGWEHAHQRLTQLDPWPEERLPASLRLATCEQGAVEVRETAEVAPTIPGSVPGPEFAEADINFDAGDQGCGDLVLALKLRFAKLAPGTLIHLIATDLGAREDLPAWCRMTGHRLERAEPPNFLIARRPEPKRDPS